MPSKCGSSFAAALTALDAYNDELAKWHNWLSCGGLPDNADKLLLYDTLKTLQERDLLEDESEWQNTAFTAFEQEMGDTRAMIDYDVGVAVEDLTSILDAPGTIAEFAAIKPATRQLEYADMFISALAASLPGKQYLADTVASVPADEDSTPILHPDRLIKNIEGNFDISDIKADHQDERPEERVRRLKAFQPVRRSAQWLGTVFFDLLPSMVDKIGPDADQIPMERFHGYLESFVDKWLPGTSDSVSTPPEAYWADKGQALVEKLKEDKKLERGLFSSAMGKSGASVLLAIEGLNLYYTYLAFLNAPPGALPLGNLASDTAGMMNSIAALLTKILGTKSAELLAARLTIFTIPFTCWDLSMQLYDASKAKELGSTGQAVGHGVQALGHVGMVIGPCMIAKAVLAGAIVPVAGPIIAAAGLAVTIIGVILADYLQPSEQLTWACNCYFGNHWPSVSMSRGPDHQFFGFKRRHRIDLDQGHVHIEVPDIQGQISRLYHQGNPFQASITRNTTDTSNNALMVEPLEQQAGQPKVPDIPYTGGIDIKRAEYQQAEQCWDFLPVYCAPLATTTDPGPGIPAVVGGPGDKLEIVESWNRDFTNTELSAKNDSGFDTEDSWYEIDILPYVMRKHIQLKV